MGQEQLRICFIDFNTNNNNTNNDDDDDDDDKTIFKEEALYDWMIISQFLKLNFSFLE